MIISTSEIKNEGLGFHFNHENALVKKHLKSLIQKSDISIEGYVYPIVGGYDVSGTIKTNLPLACSFCANQIPIPVEEKFHEIILQGKSSLKSKKEDDDLEISYISGNEIDLSPIIKEILEVSIPIQPKCVEKGAPSHYPHCVADWDYEKYFDEHTEKPLSSPFDILKNLKKN